MIPDLTSIQLVNDRITELTQNSIGFELICAMLLAQTVE